MIRFVLLITEVQPFNQLYYNTILSNHIVQNEIIWSRIYNIDSVVSSGSKFDNKSDDM